jgi:hypothetical protein
MCLSANSAGRKEIAYKWIEPDVAKNQEGLKTNSDHKSQPELPHSPQIVQPRQCLERIPPLLPNTIPDSVRMRNFWKQLLKTITNDMVFGKHKDKEKYRTSHEQDDIGRKQ